MTNALFIGGANDGCRMDIPIEEHMVKLKADCGCVETYHRKTLWENDNRYRVFVKDSLEREDVVSLLIRGYNKQ